MATLRQTAANRRNALLSTGPTSDEGKARSRVNALKHGLAGAGVVLPDEEAQAVALRAQEWRDRFQPANEEDEWLFEQVVVNSVRLDACRERESGLRIYEARRAGLSWDDDRRLAAEEVAASLAKDPARVSRRLARTRQGCDWLLERWHALGAAFERAGEWSDAQRSLALDMLGTPPSLRDGPPPDEPLALVRDQVERLEDLRADTLDELDEIERSAAEHGLEIEQSPALARLRRYEAACLRRYHWARTRLLHTDRPAHLDPEAPPVVAPPRLEPPPAPVPLPSPPADADRRADEADKFREAHARKAARVTPSAPLPMPAATPAPLRGPNRKARRAARKLVSRTG